MAEATEQELRDMLGGLTGVSSSTITLYLDDAKAIVLKQDIAVANHDFGQLQRYKTAALMSGNGIGGTMGPIESERVADVSIKYGTSGSSSLGTLYATNWEREYIKLLNAIQGFESRCL